MCEAQTHLQSSSDICRWFSTQRGAHSERWQRDVCVRRGEARRGGGGGQLNERTEIPPHITAAHEVHDKIETLRANGYAAQRSGGCEGRGRRTTCMRGRKGGAMLRMMCVTYISVLKRIIEMNEKVGTESSHHVSLHPHLYNMATHTHTHTCKSFH